MAIPDILEDRFATLRRRHPEIDSRAYFFVLAALRKTGRGLSRRRHVTGGELLEAVRSLAIERFGLMAKPVLEHWGVRATEDIGLIVFGLIEEGLLVKADGDRPEDFVDVFDFEEAFEINYPWNTLPGGAGSGGGEGGSSAVA